MTLRIRPRHLIYAGAATGFLLWWAPTRNRILERIGVE